MPRDSRRAGAPISLGDALLAAARMTPRDAATREAILAALDFVPASAPAPFVRVGPWLDHDRVVVPPPRVQRGQASDPPVPSIPSSSQVPSSVPLTDTPVPSISGGKAELRDEGTSTFAVPAWALAPADPFLAAAGDADSLPPAPLFPSPASRGILTAALAIWSTGNELDIDRTIASLATGLPLRRLPLRQAPTLRRGAQVLVDRADAMAPFRFDIDVLVSGLERLFASGDMQVLQFKHCPSRGVRDGASRRAHQPPGRGVPVLIVSDFGIGTPVEDDGFVDTAEWLSFSGDIAQAGCWVVALTPFAPRRWPAALTGAMTFVHWSERTTARQVARALRESRRGGTKAYE